ncbi:MAG: DUF4252 domain-containing protein [Bryobacterales bacterium]|nr:DUF4252 domain-containing protein [Bryobacterales bacterium]
MFIRMFLLLTVSVVFTFAQQLRLPAELEKQLREQAEEVAEVDLDQSMLGLARQMLSSKDAGQAKAKQVIERLKGVYVRVYEFAGDNAYNPAQLEPLRAQLAQGAWKKLVNVRNTKSGEHVEVYLRMENNAPAGLAVIAAAARELAIVHLDGPINLQDLGELGGSFGIPKLGAGAVESSVNAKEEE